MEPELVGGVPYCRARRRDRWGCVVTLDSHRLRQPIEAPLVLVDGAAVGRGGHSHPERLENLKAVPTKSLLAAFSVSKQQSSSQTEVRERARYRPIQCDGVV